MDGEIARRREFSTDFGAFLDTITDYWLDSLGVLTIGYVLLKNINSSIVLVVVSSTIAIRLMSQFVVKISPYKNALIPLDTRDVAIFFIFVGCILTSLLEKGFISIIVFSLISTQRAINGIYRILLWRKSIGKNPFNFIKPQ